jgi:hypothetical protein
MKYETPKVSELMPAIKAVQTAPGMSKNVPNGAIDYLTGVRDEEFGAYRDWE